VFDATKRAVFEGCPPILGAAGAAPGDRRTLARALFTGGIRIPAPAALQPSLCNDVMDHRRERQKVEASICTAVLR
jgi:hypothetical protein